MSHAEKHRTNDGCKIQGHNDAIVVDQKGDHELDKLPEPARSPDRLPQPFESDAQIVLALRQHLGLGALPQPEENRRRKDRKEHCRDHH